MPNRGLGSTALGAATCRLIEQYQPEATRLFTDPVVRALVGAPVRLMMAVSWMRAFTIDQTDALAPGVYGAQVCRTRYIDDAVQAALAQGIDQLVVLGAGFDTRPYRLPAVEGVRMFELDRPALQEDKKQKLRKYYGRLPERVTYLPIDFNTQTLESVMRASAFDRSRPAVFVWEGVTQYISEQAVRQTLDFVGRCAPGSLLVLTYVLLSIIERRSDVARADVMMDYVEKNKAPWVFGLDPAGVAAFLEPYRLELLSDVGSAYYQQAYLQPLKRALTVSEAERIALARVSRG